MRDREIKENRRQKDKMRKSGSGMKKQWSHANTDPRDWKEEREQEVDSTMR